MVSPDGKERKAKVLQPFGFLGLDRIEMDAVRAGDIACFTGIDKLGISDVICDPEKVGKPTAAVCGRANDLHDVPS